MRKMFSSLFMFMIVIQLFSPSAVKFNVANTPNKEKTINKNRSELPAAELDSRELIPVEFQTQSGRPLASAREPYYFGNPAGCSPKATAAGSSAELLDLVQEQLGDELNLLARRRSYIWNASQASYVDISDDPFVFEFEVNEFQYPFTYKSDRTASILVQNGFVIWFRAYDNEFRLLVIALLPGIEKSIWSAYLDSYWKEDGVPPDEYIVPVAKKLPCHWVVDQGFVSGSTLRDVFDLDWQIPDYLQAGRQYLASSCQDANQVSREKIGFWDATSMCGPLTWQINHDSNGFPYRIGNYQASSALFINANPRYWGARPWIGFDPETYDMALRTQDTMAGFDFNTRGNLYTGDILFSYGSVNQWAMGGGNFSHIFMVAGIDENNSRLAVTNMVKNAGGTKDCFIREVVLYTPGDLGEGVINEEWNDHGYGITGKYGFDVFRWKWITYHHEGQPIEYTVRWGETVETIGFDWKVSPILILEVNHFQKDVQLFPGQVISLPDPDGTL